MLGPVMQRGWIEDRSVGPDQRIHLGIDPNLAKHPLVPEWTVQLTGKNRSKIDRLLRPVIEADPKRVGGNPSCSRFQSAASSGSCSSAQASTSLLCRRGSIPAIIRRTCTLTTSERQFQRTGSVPAHPYSTTNDPLRTHSSLDGRAAEGNPPRAPSGPVFWRATSRLW